jgi:hypothetical protein
MDQWRSLLSRDAARPDLVRSQCSVFSEREAMTAADSIGSNFTDRLAAHLADVKNSDKAHRFIKPEAEQKLEALTRMVYEMNGEVSYLRSRLITLPDAVDAAERAEMDRCTKFGATSVPEAVLDHARLDSLIDHLAGLDEDEDSVY